MQNDPASAHERFAALSGLLRRHGVPHNRDQLAAVAGRELCTLLVAGAGTGKTTTIEGRVASLVHHDGMRPEDILCMSFTRQATRELAERIERIAPGLQIRTFHAFGLSVLRETCGRAPRVAFLEAGSLDEFMADAFASLLREETFLRDAALFFAQYRRPISGPGSLRWQRLRMWADRGKRTSRVASELRARLRAGTVRSYEGVADLCGLAISFLHLLKSGDGDLAAVVAKVHRRRLPREAAFLDLFAPMYAAYQRRLDDAGEIDFHDMLLKAAAAISAGNYAGRFRAMIIDEFQDVSRGKIAMVQALRRANPAMTLFCVGDDWQSIYRFSGSDVSLMTEFERHFGPTTVRNLEVSNRFCDEIAAMSNAFVQKNPAQRRKRVRGNRRSGRPPLTVVRVARDAGRRRDGSVGNPNERILAALNAEAGKRNAVGGDPVRLRVFLLGRYNMRLCRHVDEKLLAAWRAKFPNLTIEFLTVHASKGLTCDVSIIQDVGDGKLGFPGEAADDPLLGLVMSAADRYPFAEERRVMYVALTRARHKVFMLTVQGRESRFVAELERLSAGWRS